LILIVKMGLVYEVTAVGFQYQIQEAPAAKVDC
jgi:hypothetical protein